jgi:hypothetical protein
MTERWRLCVNWLHFCLWLRNEMHIVLGAWLCRVAPEIGISSLTLVHAHDRLLLKGQIKSVQCPQRPVLNQRHIIWIGGSTRLPVAEDWYQYYYLRSSVGPHSSTETWHIYSFLEYMQNLLRKRNRTFGQQSMYAVVSLNSVKLYFTNYWVHLRKN